MLKESRYFKRFEELKSEQQKELFKTTIKIVTRSEKIVEFKAVEIKKAVLQFLKNDCYINYEGNELICGNEHIDEEILIDHIHTDLVWENYDY